MLQNNLSLYSDYANQTEQYEGFIDIGQPDNLLLFTIIWPLIAVVGILANLCVIFVMIFSAKLTSATQFFIINLAISDILFLAICPTLVLINVHKLISFDQMPGLLAKLVCKADYFSSHLTVFITCLTLMSMTFDRYIVIMHPLKSLSYRTKSKAVMINLIIWALSVLLSVPHGYYRVLENIDNVTFCMNSEDLEEIKIVSNLNLNQFNLLYTIIISYIIPFITIVICYLIMINKLVKEKPVLLTESIRSYHVKEAHKRRRILIMIAFVTILFGVSWLPIHGLHVAMKFFPESFPFRNKNLFTFKNLAHTLTYLNSMLNPFFYTMMGNNFRKQIFARKKQYSTRFKTYYSRSNENVRHGSGVSSRLLSASKFRKKTESMSSGGDRADRINEANRILENSKIGHVDIEYGVENRKSIKFNFAVNENKDCLL